MADRLTIEYVSQIVQNFRKLDAGRIDYLIAPEHNAQIKASALGFADKITILPAPINSENEYMAISKQSPCLKYLPDVNKKLEEMIQNGTVERLIEKYIQKVSSKE